jgi:hypothetical protein
MEQYPGDGSPADAESSPKGDDDLSRLRRAGRWLGWFGKCGGVPVSTVEFPALADPQKAANQGDEQTTKAGPSESRSQRAAPRFKDPYPNEIEVGGAAYGSGAPFSADWRANLPIGDSDRPRSPSEFITHDDPEYRAVLRLLMQVPVD